MHMHFGWGKNVQEHPEEDPELMEEGAPGHRAKWGANRGDEGLGWQEGR